MIEERRLWMAVLTQAMHDLIGIDLRLRRKTLLWFESDNSETGSFRWICDHFGIDASWLRRQMLQTVAPMDEGLFQDTKGTSTFEANRQLGDDPHSWGGGDSPTIK